MKEDRWYTRTEMTRSDMIGVIVFCCLLAACITVLGLATGAFGQEWHTANQATVEWNATTTLVDGSDIPADNTAEYALYLANAVTDPGKASPVLVQDNIAALTYTITLSVEGSYFVGLETIRKDAEGIEVSRSARIWSDDPAAVTTPFGIIYVLSPSSPTGLQISP